MPANKIGHQVYSAAQLKTMQEIITLIVFAIFSVHYLGEPLRWNHGVSFLSSVARRFLHSTNGLSPFGHEKGRRSQLMRVFGPSPPCPHFHLSPAGAALGAWLLWRAAARSRTGQNRTGQNRPGEDL